jgi:transmembrane sensor
VITCGIGLLVRKPVVNTVQPTTVAHASYDKKQSSQIEQKNRTKKPMSIVLQDGSVAELSPSSEIRYAPTFSNNRRDIYLKGSGLFKVAKDASRPFTVYAGGLATTALGTVFRVTEHDKGWVRVQLYKGRVVVHPDSSLKSKGLEAVFLRPGEQVNLDQNTLAFIVKKIQIQRNVSPQGRLIKEVLHFNNQPLADIMQIMQTKYHTHIVYSDSLLNGINFTGVFNENKETLDDFLGTICLLNNLVAVHEEGCIVLLPKQEDAVPDSSDKNTK